MLDARLRADEPVDLQIHTVYSDGQWLPDELFTHLAARGFRAVAITDHDTLEHVESLCALGARHGVHVVPGTELTTEWRGHPAHLLCYAGQLAGDALAAVAGDTARRQQENTLAVHDELVRRGFTFPSGETVLAGEGGALLRPVDNARLLLAHGQAGDMATALAMIRDAGYRQALAPLDRAIAAAHASGAVAILAHPGRGGGEIFRFDPPLIEEMLADVPLDGIEVYYPIHSDEQTAAYAALARRRDLLVGAGSDSHGPQQRLPVAYPARSVAALLARCGVQVR
jgi:predicted metal-dependent phosphoesterase TrpH